MRSFLTWLLSQFGSGGLTVKHKVAYEGRAATAFVAWDSPGRFSNGSVVLVFAACGAKILRQHIVVDGAVEAGAPPCVLRGGVFLDRIRPELGTAGPSANATFQHHFSTFGAGVTPSEAGEKPPAASTAAEQAKDYIEDSIVSVYNHVTAKHQEFKGASSIQEYFAGLYGSFTDVSSLRAPLWDIDEGSSETPGVVFLVWRCPGSGYIGGTDTFVLDAQSRIVRQFVVDVKR